MKLTKSLKSVIVQQFKDGIHCEYLATLYGFKIVQVEDVIRDYVNNQEEEGKNGNNERARSSSAQ